MSELRLQEGGAERGLELWHQTGDVLRLACVLPPVSLGAPKIGG